jgi:hypothetical protein
MTKELYKKLSTSERVAYWQTRMADECATLGCDVESFGGHHRDCRCFTYAVRVSEARRSLAIDIACAAEEAVGVDACERFANDSRLR